MAPEHVNGVSGTGQTAMPGQDGCFGPPEGYGALDQGPKPAPVVAVIEPRILFSQCLLTALQSLDRGGTFKIYPSVADWRQAPDAAEAAVVLLCMPGAEGPDAALAAAERDLADLQALHPPVLFAVMADREEPERILKALDSGVRAYIPTSLSLEVALQILHLVIAGGVFVPASSFVAMAHGHGREDMEAEGTFTLSARQLSVAKALRKGMPNKLIAYELNMCESTVKVHVRNIMKKLKARNRTEAALLSSRLFSDLDK